MKAYEKYSYKDIDLERGRHYCRELFPNTPDEILFSVNFLIQKGLGDAWVSPGGEVFPFEGSFCHITFESEIGAKRGSLMWKNLEEEGWLRLSSGDCFFEHYLSFDYHYPIFLTQKQKDILIDLIEAPRFDKRGCGTSLCPEDILRRDEELRGRI